MRYLSLCSGIEAASVAAAPLGWEPVAFAEIDPFACAVLAHRFPDVPNLGDISQIDWSDFNGRYGAVDIIVSGTPCTSFSIAGTRTGLRGASGLMLEFIRAVAQVRPRWLVWENVPGALSSTGGADFGCLLRELDELGYGLAWRVLDAQFFGVAQRRRRVFLVGRAGDVRGPAEVLLERAGVPWGAGKGAEKRAELASAARGGARAAGFKFHQGAGAGGVGFEPEQSSTLTADWHNPAVLCMTDTQSNTSVEEDVCGTVSRHSSKDAPVVLTQYGDDVAGTLTARADSSPCADRGQNMVAVALDYKQTPKASVDICHTLTHEGTGGIHSAVAFAANQRGELRLEGGDGSVMGALQTRNGTKQLQAVLCLTGTRGGNGE